MKQTLIINGGLNPQLPPPHIYLCNQMAMMPNTVQRCNAIHWFFWYCCYILKALDINNSPSLNIQTILKCQSPRHKFNLLAFWLLNLPYIGFCQQNNTLLCSSLGTLSASGFTELYSHGTKLRADCMNATQQLSLLNSPIWVGST